MSTPQNPHGLGPHQPPPGHNPFGGGQQPPPPPQYQWGAPPPHAPPPSQRTSGGNTVLVVVGILLLVIVAAGVATYWWLTRPTPPGPLGWNEDTLAQYVDNDMIATCDLGEEFYNSVGISDVTVDGSVCEGWTVSPDGQPSYRVHVEVSRNGWQLDSDDAIVSSPSEPLEPHWEQYELDTAEWIDSFAVCSMTAKDRATSSVVVESNGPCESLYPVAAQLTNLGLQIEGDNPDYLAVPAQDYQARSEDYHRVLAEAQEVGGGNQQGWVDRFGNPNIINIVGVSFEDDGTVCATMDFTLGLNPSSASFDVPELLFWAPNTTLFVGSRGEANLRMGEGDTETLTQCTDTPLMSGVRGDGELLIGYLNGDWDYVEIPQTPEDMIASWTTSFPTVGR